MYTFITSTTKFNRIPRDDIVKPKSGEKEVSASQSTSLLLDSSSLEIRDYIILRSSSELL